MAQRETSRQKAGAVARTATPIFIQCVNAFYFDILHFGVLVSFLILMTLDGTGRNGFIIDDRFPFPFAPLRNVVPKRVKIILMRIV